MLTCFDVFLSLLGGVNTQPALGSFLAYVANLSAGAILVMAFSRPLRDKF